MNHTVWWPAQPTTADVIAFFKNFLFTGCSCLVLLFSFVCRQLLTRDPSKRLGSSLDDAQEVQRHPFFGPLDWDMIMRREVAPPWEPNVVGSLDTSQFDREFTSMPIFSPEQREHRVNEGVKKKVLSSWFSSVVCSTYFSSAFSCLFVFSDDGEQSKSP